MRPGRSAKCMAIAFVGCVTAAVMLVVFDFAGWETGGFSTRTTFTSRADPVDIFRTRVSGDDRTVANFYYSSVSVSGPYSVLIAPVVALLVFGAYVSYRGLRSGSESVAGNSLRRAFGAAVIAGYRRPWWVASSSRSSWQPTTRPTGGRTLGSTEGSAPRRPQPCSFGWRCGSTVFPFARTDGLQSTSSASTLRSTLPFRALEMGQPSLAASAASLKAADSIPGTVPRTVRALDATFHPP